MVTLGKVHGANAQQAASTDRHGISGALCRSCCVARALLDQAKIAAPTQGRRWKINPATSMPGGRSFLVLTSAGAAQVNHKDNRSPEERRKVQILNISWSYPMCISSAAHYAPPRKQ